MTAHPKKSESIEEILRKYHLNMTSEWDGLTTKEATEEAVQSLEALYNQRMEYVIGEDENYITLPLFRKEQIATIKARNQLRAIQRTRAGINKKEEV